MDLQLEGKTALVTGSSAGIGEAIVRLLAREGVRVIVHGRQAEAARHIAGQIREHGGVAAVAVGDVGTDEGAGQVAQASLEAFGQIDILVNNAGKYPWVGWWDSRPGDWADVYNVDVLSCVRLVQRLVPHMVEHGWGRVIQLSSASGYRAPANLAPLYACTKAAQTHMARCLALELTGTGVTVNAVSPAPVSTKTTLDLFREPARAMGYGESQAEVERYFVENVMHNPPVQRMATPEEVASTVAYLCSPLASHITGAEFLADCGYSVSGFRMQPSQIPRPDERLVSQALKSPMGKERGKPETGATERLPLL